MAFSSQHTKASTASTLEVGNMLGGDTTRRAEPSQLKGYPLPWNIMLSNKISNRKMQRVLVLWHFFFFSNHYMCWGPALQGISSAYSWEVVYELLFAFMCRFCLSNYLHLDPWCFFTFHFSLHLWWKGVCKRQRGCLAAGRGQSTVVMFDAFCFFVCCW